MVLASDPEAVLIGYISMNKYMTNITQSIGS